VEPDGHAGESRKDLAEWARQNLPAAALDEAAENVDLLRPTEMHAEVAATLLYPVTDYSFRKLYEMTTGWSAAQRTR
jgi:hypothetical protein